MRAWEGHAVKPFPFIAHRPDVPNLRGLIVAFHGWGQRPRRIKHRWGLDAVANETGCLIVYPRARGLNWGGLWATQPRRADVQRMDLTLRAIEGEHGFLRHIHLVGFSDGASFALYAGTWLGQTWTVASVTAYSGLHHEAPGTPIKYPILLIRNNGETLIEPKHQKAIADAYAARGHQVTRLNLPRRRRWGRHHYWRPAEANPIVSKHIVDAMREPILTGENS